MNNLILMHIAPNFQVWYSNRVKTYKGEVTL